MSLRLFVLPCVVALASLPPVAGAPADLDVLLAGVTEVTAPGCLVGSVAAFGDDAFVVVSGASGKSRLPVIAAARYGQGRALIAGHEGLYGAHTADNKALLVNTVRWLAGGKEKPRVALVDYRGCAPALTAAGCRVTNVAVGKLREALQDADVLLAHGQNFTAPDRAEALEAVAAFVQRGGGYFGAVPGWGWQQLNGSLSLANDFGGNKLVNRMGLAWCDGGVDGTGRQGWLADRSGLALTQGGVALAALVKHADGTARLAAAEVAQVTSTLTSAAGALPESDKLFLPKLRELVAQQGADAVPMPKAPLKLDKPIARIACVIQNMELRRARVEQLQAHPAAQGFPGPVPADAPRVERGVTLDTSVPGWHSLGLYAAPGEALTVTLPPAAVKAGLGLRIGCHTDHIWHHNSWERFPEISYATGLRAETTRYGNPFGGLVYLTVPDGCKLGKVTVGVKGAVESPLFVLGETSLEQWRQTIRGRPTPFAELATRKIILSLPASVVRNLDDPEAVLKEWDKGMDAIADLAAMPRARTRPERMTCDQQISAGYMHSGYPIMTFLDVPPSMVSRERMAGGARYCWGFWHELGHNHQSGHWTFGGTGEVMCNLFSLYCNEVVSGEKVADSTWLNPKSRNKGVARYFANGAKFSEWCADPALALMMYAQLQQAFGWDAYKRTFAAYRAAQPGTLPKNDDEKRDQFMVRFSRTVGRNLAPFFQAWGIPTSEQARKSLENLPRWEPKDLANGIPFGMGL